MTYGSGAAQTLAVAGIPVRIDSSARDSLVAAPGRSSLIGVAVPSSDPEPRSGTTSSTPSSPYSPDLTGVPTISGLLDLVRITPMPDGWVLVAFVRGSDETLEVAASDVTQWCAETSVLMRVTFELAIGDEVRVRTPMLVGRRGGALAVVRQVTNEESKLIVASAATTAELANGSWLSNIDVTFDEARSLLMALEGAARAAMSPRANL